MGRLSRDASQDPALLRVATCPAVARVLAAVIGAGQVDTIGGVQVALRFPGCNDALVVSGSAVRGNVGPSDWHTDGLRQGKKHSFSLLLGVALSDMTAPDVGNLFVWPGSHLVVHRLMRHPDGRSKF